MDLYKFTDKSLIASYAVEGIATLVKEGLIAGSANKINPKSNATRAEAAVLLCGIYNKYAE
ncbi:MAG: S-layer homology domain-containing protein [Tepidanaerobacteraceae bacterium]|nr:S-layer homology domain-containing protein [Tepidanaerobacteraceae bacterium]